jgi:hypothetical protein
MKKFAAFMTIVVAVMFSAGLVIGAEIAAGKEKLVLKELQKEKGAVSFDHKGHADRMKNCKLCHHKEEDGKEQKCSTATCHGAKAEGKKLVLKEAFHQNCRECHKKDATKKAPTKCEGCHAKK